MTEVFLKGFTIKLLSSLLLLVLSFNIHGFTPEKVESVSYHPFLIEFPHTVTGEAQVGGWVLVLDIKSKKIICTKKVYTAKETINSKSEIKHNYIVRRKHHGEIITIFDSFDNVHKLFISDICK